MTDLWPQLGAKRIDLAEEQDFAIGELRVSPTNLTAERNGERVELQPRVMQVLVALAQARSAVVSRDKLVESCWEGRIVGDDALNRCILALRHLAQRFTPTPFVIETVPRVGHRLVECAEGAAAHSELRKPSRSWRGAVLAVVLLIAVVGGSLLWQRQSALVDPASIAVLPFRNLSASDPYFAEGVSEEILGRLAREPQFQVAGSTSSTQAGKSGDVREAARKLNVDYVVEGSVRRQGNHVRVNAALLRVRDGARLWSNSFDGKLDDILQIQGAIGQAVADGLRRKLIFAAANNPARPMDGEAYALYLNARGLVRSGNPQAGHEAVNILKEVIRRAPTFAPAWASLAAALQLEGRTNGNEGMIGVIPEGLAAARQAMRLDPNLAEAHAVYADFVGNDSLEGIAHMRRAGELGPSSGEGTMRRGMALHASGDFPAAYRAFGRAHELDPLWSMPTRSIGDNKALVGDSRGATAYVQRAYADDRAVQDFALARVAWFTGDFSEAVRLWSGLAKGQSQWSSPSKLSLENALYLLKLSKNPPSRPPRPSIGQNRTTPANVWIAAPPATEWQRRNRSAAAELVYRDENVVAAKLMLNAGRAPELVSTYDSPTGLLGIRRGETVGTCFLQNAALVAVALRASGRNDEANEILRQSALAIQAAYRRGIVPLWFDDDAAGIFALRGQPELAVAALDRAFRRGSTHTTRTDLPKLADEPALRSLHGYAAFEAISAKYQDHFIKERQETMQALRGS